jgi:hypothetical protein
MNELKQLWDKLISYFVQKQVEAETPQLKTKVKRKATKKVVSKTIINPPQIQTALEAIEMMSESIKLETNTGKKKYKSRLLRNLNKSIELNEQEMINKSILRIVNYLYK